MLSLPAVAHATPVRRPRRGLAALVLLGLLLPLGPGVAPAAAQGVGRFDGLRPGQRVYDRTGSSLSAPQRADLERRLDALPGGADAIVYVRERDADPDETLDEVEALQAAWAFTARSPRSTAVAFLINREPGEPDEARAGVYAGTTFDDGNVPGDEQVDIVDEALIPPLREGDVHASLVAGVDRLARDIREGPPQGAFDRWAARAGTSWLPWVGLGLALAGLAAAAQLIRRRTRTDVARPAPTTTRPDGELTPALGAALGIGWHAVEPVPGTILALATRGAIALETEEPTERRKAGRVAVRLADRDRLRDDRVEQALWKALQRRGGRDGVVSSTTLAKHVGNDAYVGAALRRAVDERGWIAQGSLKRKLGLTALWILAAGALILSIAVADTGSAPLMLVAIVPLGLLALVGFAGSATYPRLSAEGLAAAQPWRAYHRGLKRAAKDRDQPLDLDVALPDAVAMGLGPRMKKRVDAAVERGEVPRAFRDAQGLAAAAVSYSAFSDTFPTASGDGGSTVSGGGGDGGGGAAGST